MSTQQDLRFHPTGLSHVAAAAFFKTLQLLHVVRKLYYVVIPGKRYLPGGNSEGGDEAQPTRALIWTPTKTLDDWLIDLTDLTSDSGKFQQYEFALWTNVFYVSTHGSDLGITELPIYDIAPDIRRKPELTEKLTLWAEYNGFQLIPTQGSYHAYRTAPMTSDAIHAPYNDPQWKGKFIRITSNTKSLG